MPRRKPKPDIRGPLQRIHDREAAQHGSPAEPNAFARQHGAYERVHGIDGTGMVNMRPHINRGGTPIARWRAAHLLTDSQNAAIDHCVRHWEVMGLSGSLVANLDRTVFGQVQTDGLREHEALTDMHRIQGYFPVKYWSIFESVCRFDEPAGFVGSRLTEVRDEQAATCRTVVQFVADVIAWKERLSY
jgi:hypothetical protein